MCVVPEMCRARNVSWPRGLTTQLKLDSSLCSHVAHCALTALSFGSMRSHSAHCTLTRLTALSLGSLRSHSAHCALTRLIAPSLGSMRAHSARCALTRLGARSLGGRHGPRLRPATRSLAWTLPPAPGCFHAHTGEARPFALALATKPSAVEALVAGAAQVGNTTGTVATPTRAQELPSSHQGDVTQPHWRTGRGVRQFHEGTGRDGRGQCRTHQRATRGVPRPQ